MGERYITLPALDYKKVSLGAYVRAIKVAKLFPDREFKTGLDTWWPTTGSEIVRQFRKAMNDRINEATPYVDRGAKRR